MENNQRPVPPPPQSGKTPLRQKAPNKPLQQPHPSGLRVQRPRRRWWPWVLIGAAVTLILALAAAFVWYQQSLTPVDSSNADEVRITINEGETASQIARTLKEHDLIRNVFAFQLYARGATSMQAGAYVLTRTMSVPEIIDHLSSGRSDDFQVTFIPGSTIWDIKENLIETGYTEAEVDAALNADYDHPLFASKPANSTLEGYIFPDTYQVEGAATVEEIFELTFDEFYQQLQDNDLLPAFQERDLTLYEAITLGSIIQKEVANPEDERQVAQIFYKRLNEGIPLGADATFIYGALVQGVEPRVTLDSPYNTRQVTGLPPGPISNVAISALQAVANPAEGDYLFFVSGDDGTTHFTRTQEEHEEATARYCHENCDIFRN